MFRLKKFTRIVSVYLLIFRLGPKNFISWFRGGGHKGQTGRSDPNGKKHFSCILIYDNKKMLDK